MTGSYWRNTKLDKLQAIVAVIDNEARLDQIVASCSETELIAIFEELEYPHSVFNHNNNEYKSEYWKKFEASIKRVKPLMRLISRKD